jgi:hypothetical protein
MKKYIFPILSILCLIISFFILIKANHNHSKIEKSYDQKIKVLDLQKKDYQVKYNNYKHYSDSINSKYLKTDFDLKNLIKINNLLRNRLSNIVQSTVHTDTSNNFLIQDSIKDIAINLADSSNKSDSLCLEQINRLENLTKAQEKQIQYCDSVYTQNQTELKSTLENIHTIQTENNQLKKQVRRNRLLAKVEGLTLLVTATFLTTIILTH